MTQTEKDSKLKELQAEAKDYQAELGYLLLQKTDADKRIASLSALVSEGERKFQALVRVDVEAPPAPVPAPESEHA